MKCPECKKVLKEVKCYSQCVQTCQIDKDGNTGEWTLPEVLEGDSTYECPHCGTEIPSENINTSGDFENE